jgi:hypothetical protein
MSTTSTQAMTTDLRNRLLNFAPETGATLNSRLGGRLYVSQAPDEVDYPYAVIRLVDRRQTDGYAGMRESFEIELAIFDRPRGKQWQAEAIADVAQQAFLKWEVYSSGLMFSRHTRRVTMPVAPSPMDRELVHLVLFVPVVAWPVMFTQYYT